MDRLSHISVADNIATIKERHHHRNALDLAPCAYAETLSGAARRSGHRVGSLGTLREGGADRCCTLTSHKRREFAAREPSKWRARSSKPHAQRESITNRRREREAPTASRGWEAATGTTRMLQLPTATGIPSGCHDNIRREAHRTTRANEVDTPPLQRLA